MFCFKCNKKLNVRNIIRLSENNSCCKECYNSNSNIQQNQNYNKDFENKKNELYVKSFILLNYDYSHYFISK